MKEESSIVRLEGRTNEDYLMKDYKGSVFGTMDQRRSRGVCESCPELVTDLLVLS